MPRALKWIGGLVAVVVILVVGFAAGLALFGGNWLRAPIERLAIEKTGRPLKIAGDLRFGLGWGTLWASAAKVTFANPAWAQQKNMISADEVELVVNLPQVLRRGVAVDQMTLRRAVVFLEKDAEGRQNWLLDLKQKDENSTLRIGRLALDASRLDYDEPLKKTSIRADVASTRAATAGADITFNAKGQYLGMPLVAHGSGGSLLALRDESRPYPFQIEGSIGPTRIKAAGAVTGLSKITALDVQVALEGRTLAELYLLLGIALPETHPYRTAGHVTHSARSWRYEKFSAHVGSSDFSGTLAVDSGGKRPFLHGDLVFGQLNFTDLGPVIGADDVPPPVASTTPAAAHGVLPDVPFRAARWHSVDADVKLSAATILHAKELPLDHLAVRLQLRDAVLTLDPLEFGVAGGTLAGAITLNGQRNPIRSSAKVRVNKLMLDKLFPTMDLSKASFGQIHGEINLAGIGDSVARMLGSANGTAALVIAGGQVSKLAMEMAGLHVLEIVALKLTGDRPIGIRCAVADFKIDDGTMKTQTLLFDTTITTLIGSGTVALGAEKLDLTLVPQTKETSLVSLRGPLHIRGTFTKPEVKLDTGTVAARGLAAAALAVVNPLLALVPLIEQGPGMESDCGRLVTEAGGKPPSPSKAAK